MYTYLLMLSAVSALCSAVSTLCSAVGATVCYSIPTANTFTVQLMHYIIYSMYTLHSAQHTRLTGHIMQP
jgi:hypothetical protein